MGGREYGSVIFTQHYDTDPPHITIDRADPHVLVTDQTLNDIYANRGRRWHGSVLRLDPSPPKRYCEPPCQYPSHPFCWTDWLLHLDVAGRHLVYRIGKYRLEQNIWEASWPD